MVDQPPEAIVESLKSVAIDYGLRRVEAVTDTATIVVEEPPIFGPMHAWGVTIKEHNL